MSNTDLDLLAHSLGRIRDYGTGLTQPERKTIQSAIDVLPSADKALHQTLPVLATLDALLTILADVPRYKKMLSDLTALIRQAKEDREAAARAAADLEHKQSTIGPDLAAVKAAHDRQLVSEREQFDRHCADSQKTLAAREAGVAALEQKAKETAAAAAKLKADLERRLEVMRSAAA